MDALLEIVWGEQVVEPNVVHRAVSRIRRALEDNPRRPEYIETIPKRGYRTLAVVSKEVFERAPGQSERGSVEQLKAGVSENLPPEHLKELTTAPVTRQRPAVSPLAVAFALTVVLALTADGMQRHGQNAIHGGLANHAITEPTIPVNRLTPSAPGLTSKAAKNDPAATLTIQVFPFENLSPVADHEYYASGFSEALIYRLSKLEDLTVVIGRPGAQDQSGSNQQLPTAAKANKSLTGSLRYDSERDWVSIFVRIVDSRTGHIEWSENYEQPVAGLARLQGVLAKEVASRLEVDIAPVFSTTIGAASTRNPDAYALYLKVLADLRSYRFQSLHEDLDRAIALDPDFVLAMAQKAHLYSLSATSGFGSSTPMTAQLANQHLEQATRYANQALQVDDEQPLAVLALARVHFAKRRWLDAYVHAEQALALAPNDVSTQFFYASNLFYRHENQQAIRVFQRAIQAEPWNPSLPLFAGGRAILAGEHSIARRWLLLAAERDGGALSHYAYAMLVQNAIYSESRHEIGDILRRVELLYADQDTGPLVTAILLDAYTLTDDQMAQKRYRLKLEQQLSVQPTRSENAGFELSLQLALGEPEAAIWALNRILDFGFPATDAADLNFHSDSAKFRALRAHPDFAALKARAAKPIQASNNFVSWNDR